MTPELLMIALQSVSGILWAFVWNDYKVIKMRLDAQSSAFNDYRVSVAREYATSEELNKTVNDIKSMIQQMDARIESRLSSIDNKFDKLKP